MKTYLKLASVAVAVVGLVLNTGAVSLASVDGPNPMAVYNSVDIARESGASQILRVTGNRTLIPEASLYQDGSTVEQETAAAQIVRVTGSVVDVPEASMYAVWGRGMPGGMANDLAMKPWVESSYGWSDSGTAVAAAPTIHRRT